MSSSTREQSHPTRLFLDAGVIIEGCFAHWGASKAELILTTLRARFTVVLAEAIEREVQRALTRRVALDSPVAEAVAQDISGWLDRIRIERYPFPTPDEISLLAPTLLPAVRHVNDLPAVITAMRARPDWVLSTNTEHWNDRLAARTGLRVATPLAFLRQLQPTEQSE